MYDNDQNECKCIKMYTDPSKPDPDACTMKCNKLKYIAEEKWKQSDVVARKAREAEQQAKAAEERAQYYKRLALESCNKSNEWWDKYRCLSDETVELMREARMYMAKSEECIKDCQCFSCNCDLSDMVYGDECRHSRYDEDKFDK